MDLTWQNCLKLGCSFTRLVWINEYSTLAMPYILNMLFVSYHKIASFLAYVASLRAPEDKLLMPFRIHLYEYTFFCFLTSQMQLYRKVLWNYVEVIIKIVISAGGSYIIFTFGYHVKDYWGIDVTGRGKQWHFTSVHELRDSCHDSEALYVQGIFKT